MEKFDKTTDMLIESAKRAVIVIQEDALLLKDEAHNYVIQSRGALNRAINARKKAPFAPGVPDWFVKLAFATRAIHSIGDKINEEMEKVKAIGKEIEHCSDLHRANELEQNATKSLAELRRLDVEIGRSYKEALEMTNRVKSLVWEFLKPSE